MQSDIRERIVEEAKGWEGTPYRHRQRCRGFGTDCIQFLIGIGEAVGLLDNPDIPFYSIQWHLHQTEDLLVNTVISMGCREITVERLQPGDIILFQFDGTLVCCHSGIYLPDNRFIHALMPYPSKVVIARFAHTWRTKWAKRFFQPPGVE